MSDALDQLHAFNVQHMTWSDLLSSFAAPFDYEVKLEDDLVILLNELTYEYETALESAFKPDTNDAFEAGRASAYKEIRFLLEDLLKAYKVIT